MYKSVRELSFDQLQELKDTFFYEHWNQPETLAYTYPAEIPDEFMFEVYADCWFCDDDFFCSMEADDE